MTPPKPHQSPDSLPAHPQPQLLRRLGREAGRGPLTCPPRPPADARAIPTAGSGREVAPCGYGRVTAGSSQIGSQLLPLKTRPNTALTLERFTSRLSLDSLGKLGRGTFSAARASADSLGPSERTGSGWRSDGSGRLPHTLPVTWGRSLLLTRFFPQEQWLVSH